MRNFAFGLCWSGVRAVVYGTGFPLRRQGHYHHGNATVQGTRTPLGNSPSGDAINAAGNRAVSEGHPDLTPAHLLLALLQGQDNENITDLLAAVDGSAAARARNRRRMRDYMADQ